jgi:hypothetical protein
MPDKEIKGKFIESRERFPKDEDFGYSAWTCMDLKSAYCKFRSLEDGES